MLISYKGFSGAVARVQCDQMMELKLPYVPPPKIAPKVTTRFLHNVDIIRNSPNGTKIFGLLLWDKLLPRTYKHRPIWSHCTWLDYILRIDMSNNDTGGLCSFSVNHSYSFTTAFHLRIIHANCVRRMQLHRRVYWKKLENFLSLR